MAASIATLTKGNGSGSNSPTQTFSVPSGVQSGDRLLLLCSGFNSGLVFNFPSGWSQVANTGNVDVTGAAFTKIADGTEGATVVATLNKDDFLGYVFLRISGASSTSLPEGVASVGSSGTPDSPSLDPSGWGVEATLWITSGHYGFKTNATGVAAPTGFSYNDGAGLNFGCPCVVASLSSSVTSKDPGAWTISPNPSGGRWVGLTIAVRSSTGPAGVASVGDVAVSSISSISGVALSSIAAV